VGARSRGSLVIQSEADEKFGRRLWTLSRGGSSTQVLIKRRVSNRRVAGCKKKAYERKEKMTTSRRLRGKATSMECAQLVRGNRFMAEPADQFRMGQLKKGLLDARENSTDSSINGRKKGLPFSSTHLRRYPVQPAKKKTVEGERQPDRRKGGKMTEKADLSRGSR